MHPLSLLNPDVCKVGVTPGGGAVSIDEGPVTLVDLLVFDAIRAWGRTDIPCRPTVILVGGVVPSLAMSAQEQDLVVNIRGRFIVQIDDLIVEPLPLSERGIGGRLSIRVICSID